MLQAEVDKLNDALKIACIHLKALNVPESALSIITQLQANQSIVSERVESL